MLEGGCSCGAIRYRLSSEPMFVHCCHCRSCQQQTGSGFVLNALIETSRVELLSGATEAVRVTTDSGRPHDIHRCTACKIAIWSHYGGRTPIAFVRAGTLDDPSAAPPSVHIFTRSKLPWIVLPADVPAFETYYDPAEEGPAESLARRNAALAS